ncbi:hypothetical protein [Streptomyces sp. NPDC003032]
MDAKNIREDALYRACRYAGKAARLAEHAEDKNHYASSERHQVPGITAVGTLYADIARTYAAIAQATPADTGEEN